MFPVTADVIWIAKTVNFKNGTKVSVNVHICQYI